ncbi:hypothetical protein HK405_010826 [Cladochytrium tenue]|nr:hypothetical protein HK405_010826 [Cladochytrium tenue]
MLTAAAGFVKGQGKRSALLLTTGEDGITAYYAATVCEEHVAAGLRADAWVDAVVRASGGRSGGGAGAAQGSSPLGEASGLAAAIERAEEFAARFITRSMG